MKSLTNISICFFVSVTTIAAQEEKNVGYQQLVRPFLSKHCFTCHGEEKQRGKLRLDTLSPNLTDEETIKTWTTLFDRLHKDEMPPLRQPRPAKESTAAVMNWVQEQLTEVARKTQAKTGRVVLRRLNRVEYEYTIRDLLALPYLDIKHVLPPDPSAHGLDNVAEAQELSYVQMARYLEAAEKALDRAMCLSEKPTTLTQRMNLQQQGRFSRGDKTGKTQKRFERGETRHVDEWVVFLRQPNSAQTPWRVNNRSPFAAGKYKFSVRCRGVVYDHGKLLPQDRNHVLSIYTREKRLLKTFDVPAKAEVIEFTAWLHHQDQIEIFCASLDDRNTPGAGPVKPYRGPGIAVEYVEVTGPWIQDWPRESHRRLFGNLPVKPWTPESGLTMPQALTEKPSRDPKRPKNSRKKKDLPWMIVSKEPMKDAERLLRHFMTKAYRRPIEESEFQRCLSFAKAGIEKKLCFQDAMRTAYKAALCSPDFLFLLERPGELDGYALGARLSYFLWRSIPDAELLKLASSGELKRPSVLKQQVERMLKDARSQRFVKDFTRQWLDLGKIHDTAPDRHLYPEYFCDNHLTESAVLETQAYFREMIEKNLGSRTVFDSDFAMLNERLAKLYGIDGVEGCRIRRVELPKDSTRGGVLTQASVMKVTANGLTTSPVLRGVWLLDRLLGQPVPPPPPNAGAIEPDTRGATTVREQLDKHRRIPSCASCHVKIDPPGFALESFDVMGAERDFYRSFDKGKPLTKKVADRPVRYKRGPKVDASGKTVHGQSFENIQDFRKLLLRDVETPARSLAKRLLTFATGAGIGYADRKTINEILEQTKQTQYGLKSMIHAVVQSRTFQIK